jgi:DNA-binding NarL/FixJ family response regulator
MGRYTILLAEGSVDAALAIRRAFEGSEAAVFLAVLPGGQHVIDYFKGSGKFIDRRQYPIPDLLILNLRLAKKNAFEVLEELRASGLPCPRRVAVLTSCARAEDILRAYELGAHFVAPKQGNLRPFVHRVDRAMIEEDQPEIVPQPFGTLTSHRHTPKAKAQRRA